MDHGNGLPRRTWRGLPGDPGTLLLVAEGNGETVLVKTVSDPWEVKDGATERLVDDAKLSAQVLAELVAYDLTDAELGAFVRLQYAPVVDSLRGRWTWTRRVSSGKPVELSPWNDSQGLL